MPRYPSSRDRHKRLSLSYVNALSWFIRRLQLSGEPIFRGIYRAHAEIDLRWPVSSTF